MSYFLTYLFYIWKDVYKTDDEKKVFTFFFPAQTTTYSEAACQLDTNLIVHPFAFRVHTHGLGRVVSGWKVTPDMSWTLLGGYCNIFIFNMISL